KEAAATAYLKQSGLESSQYDTLKQQFNREVNEAHYAPALRLLTLWLRWSGMPSYGQVASEAAPGPDLHQQVIYDLITSLYSLGLKTKPKDFKPVSIANTNQDRFVSYATKTAN